MRDIVENEARRVRVEVKEIRKSKERDEISFS